MSKGDIVTSVSAGAVVGGARSKKESEGLPEVHTESRVLLSNPRENLCASSPDERER